ncbi:vomeronasal type-2 receptor 26-like [Dendropsophus ebraccatus]|uniref:vomeronasal type-2 receptor 26-like n=1 Tax=Dendropsophus ebraccatus TaxID=150705 RepID=UPI0038322AB6
MTLEEPNITTPCNQNNRLSIVEGQGVNKCTNTDQLFSTRTTITYSTTDSLLSNRRLFPYLFQIFPSNQIQFLAIIMLLKHFEWTWIGVAASDDEAGQNQSKELKNAAAIHGICIEFIVSFPRLDQNYRPVSEKSMHILLKSTSTVMVLCGTPPITAEDILQPLCNSSKVKTLIIPAGSIIHVISAYKIRPLLDGSLVFSPPLKHVPHITRFLDDISLENRPDDIILQSILSHHFNCITSNKYLNLLGNAARNCNKSVKLVEYGDNQYKTKTLTTTLPIYRAVYAIAHSLHKMQLYPSKYPNSDVTYNLRHIYKFLEKANFEDPTGEEVFFNEKREMIEELDITNYELLPKENYKTIGKFTVTAQREQQLIMSQFQSAQQIVLQGIDESKTIATPIVKANNQTLSFCLLASIMLSFLCVFLFMGRPLHVTCMLRQTSFGIIFSVVVSCILAKVILVYMAFKATKPGCTWRNFISAKLSSSIVIIAALLQVIISTVWLSVSPPFPEANTHIYQDRIILLCNEGSMLAFYVSLAYMGLLAALSLFFAFMSRNLPDSFNEAKNITFSILVVCSVWVAFIPAYMSVTGKNTVLVEIFAVISSSVGILGCIFFPKCYIILVRPDLNYKSSLLR